MVIVTDFLHVCPWRLYRTGDVSGLYSAGTTLTDERSLRFVGQILLVVWVCVKIDRRLGVNIPYAILKDEGL